MQRRESSGTASCSRPCFAPQSGGGRVDPRSHRQLGPTRAHGRQVLSARQAARSDTERKRQVSAERMCVAEVARTLSSAAGVPGFRPSTAHQTVALAHGRTRTSGGRRGCQNDEHDDGPRPGSTGSKFISPPVEAGAKSHRESAFLVWVWGWSATIHFPLPESRFCEYAKPSTS
jgi:hypothetical protein